MKVMAFCLLPSNQSQTSVPMSKQRPKTMKIFGANDFITNNTMWQRRGFPFTKQLPQ